MQQLCKHCHKPIPHAKKKNTFCSSSCSASFNNAGRVRSPASRKRTSDAIKKRHPYTSIVWYQCTTCNTYFYRLRKFMDRKNPPQNCSRKCQSKQCSINRTGIKLGPRPPGSMYGGKPILEKTEFQQYCIDAAFHLTQDDISKIPGNHILFENGMFNPQSNKEGVVRDHMFSRYDGFTQNISPKILAHPANCEIMTNLDNLKKKSNSSITLDELHQRIKDW